MDFETPYTLRYIDGIPFIFGPPEVTGRLAQNSLKSARLIHAYFRRGLWWKLAGLGTLASLLSLIFLLPVAFASNGADSAAKSPVALARISATLEQLSLSRNLTTLVLLSDGDRAIAAYPDSQAHLTVATVAASRANSVLSVNPDGSLVFYDQAEPKHVFLAYPNLPYQIEITDPADGVALALAKTPGLLDSLLR